MESAKPRNGLAYVSIGIAVAAIAISLAVASLPQQRADQEEVPVPQTREFYLFTEVDENIEVEEDALGIPPDKFSLEEITVHQGDRVIIHFYNLEPEETQEHHTFTIGDPYQMNIDLNASENETIEFVASKTGIFEYQCVFHPPTMRGQLVVLGE